MTRVFINSNINSISFHKILENYKYNNEIDKVFLINSITSSSYSISLKKQCIHFVGDQRYYKLLDNKKKYDYTLYTFSDIFPKNLSFHKVKFFKSLGRNGFSEYPISKGIYHGCQSFYCILQISLTFNPKEIICFGPKYQYGTKIKRNNKNSDLPDFFITETALNINKYALPFFRNSNIKLIFLESIFKSF